MANKSSSNHNALRDRMPKFHIDYYTGWLALEKNLENDGNTWKFF